MSSANSRWAGRDGDARTRLEGKTIKSARRIGLDVIELDFTDRSLCVLIASGDMRLGSCTEIDVMWYDGDRDALDAERARLQVHRLPK